MEVSGDVAMGESAKACGPLGRRLYGWRRFGVFAYLVPVWVGSLVLQAVVDWFIDGSYGVWACMALLIVGSIAAIRRAPVMLRPVWAKRGVPAVSSVTYVADDAGLSINSPLQRTTMTWEGISEIAPGNGSWLVIGPGQAYFLPRRFFSAPGDEVAFLKACFDRLSPPAQERSREVAALARSGQA
jgi:hypothetical protein